MLHLLTNTLGVSQIQIGIAGNDNFIGFISINKYIYFFIYLSFIMLNKLQDTFLRTLIKLVANP